MRTSFNIHIRNNKLIKYYTNIILSYKHIENMLLILINNEENFQNTLPKKDRDYKVSNLLKDKIIMKGVLAQTKGGEKTSSDIALINTYFKNTEIFHQLLKISSSYNSHNLSMIVGKIQGSYKTYYSNYKLFLAGKMERPNKPSPKKLQRINQHSINIEPSKFTFKRKNRLGITLKKKSKYQI